MTLTTTQLGDAVGVQYAGVRDLSEVSTSLRLTVGVIVGRFKRGKFYQPFEVTLQNLRARLGYQPNNLDYVAVQDALDTGIPSIWVMRIGEHFTNFIVTEDSQYLLTDDGETLISESTQ